MKQWISIVAVIIVVAIVAVISLNLGKKDETVTAPLPRVSLDCNGTKCIK